MPVLNPAADSDLPVLICAVSGLGGIGKTSLAVYAARQAVRNGWFPGGTLFVDFRGYDDDPVTADQALVALLDGLGVCGTDLPQTSASQYALYQALLDERPSTLLLFDNASDPAQLTPLLPGTDHHRVLITSRGRLTALDARLLDLDVLTPEAAADLLTKSLQLTDPRDDRVLREPKAVAELGTLCGHHPLALRLTVGMLRERRYRSIGSLAKELGGDGDRMRVLGARPVLEAAYGQLPSDQARLLRLLSLAPTAEVSGEAAAALAGLSDSRTLTLLEGLAAACLVTPVPVAGEDVRWRLHDLVRAFGADLVSGDAELRKEGEGARERVLGWFVRWADAADDRLRWLPGMPVPERFGGRGEALAWFDGERAGLVAAVGWGREERFAREAVRLALCLAEYLAWRRYFDDWIAVAEARREAARRTGDRLDEAGAWNNLGNALREVGRVEEAVQAHTRARDLYQDVGDRSGEAGAWSGLGLALREAGGVEEAVQAHTRARDLFQAVGDRTREAVAWNNLGVALREAGGVEEAVQAHTRARDLYQAVGDRTREASAWNGLGIALEQAGRVEEAVEAYGTSLEIARECEDWYSAGLALYNLAILHQTAGRPAQARPAYLEAANAFTRANAPADAADAQSAADALT
ncbi:tetratricopeptide repeat protein [Streptomyces aquilus]|uniref:Tetratricopeptide repeat protein n=2 Tax=Streptomyces aquilus TaxID=2548456 RepID=A0A3Q9C7D5_9ACTN|nr:tetratricopeptide repeat protein [Streptomyces aquilus]AZP23549.1 tetratricopeptide repeat protein [Streptomyces aquilus]